MQAKLLTKKQKNNLRFRNARLQQTSRETYGDAVKQFFRFIVENNYPDVFDIEVIREWLARYDNAYTYNIRLQGIKEFYMKQYETRPAVQRLKVREAFETLKRITPSRSKITIDYLTVPEIKQLGSVCTDRVSCVILALFWTGCRISELINIKLTDCKVNRPVVIRVRGKGMKDRRVYLPYPEYKRITEVFKGKTYLFETQNGTQYSRTAVSAEIKRQAIQKMNIDVHAHTFRHSRAMQLKGNGFSPDEIARYLGHANVTTLLAFYFHGTPGPHEKGICEV